MPALTVSGNEITDAVRRAATSGDGRTAPDESFGIWEATTNLHPRSSFESGVTTGHVAFGAGASIAVETLSTPFLGTKALRVTTTGQSAGAGHTQSGTANMAAASASTQYAVSVWVYSENGGESVALYPEFFTAAGAYISTGTGITRTLSAGWQRITGTVTTPTNTAFLALQFRTIGTVSYSLLIKAFQVEQQPIATPYVPTDGATASRSAARVQAPASLLDETQGWVAMRVRMGFAATADPFAGSTVGLFAFADSASERIYLAYNTGADAFQCVRQTGGAGGNATGSVEAFSAGDSRTVIFAWTSTQVKLSVNGGSFVAGANTNIPTLAATLADVGTGGAVVSTQADSDVFWFACGTGTLSDADASRIHAFGNAAPIPEMFGPTAACTAVLPGNFFPNYINYPMIPVLGG